MISKLGNTSKAKGKVNGRFQYIEVPNSNRKQGDIYFNGSCGYYYTKQNTTYVAYKKQKHNIT